MKEWEIILSNKSRKYLKKLKDKKLKNILSERIESLKINPEIGIH